MTFSHGYITLTRDRKLIHSRSDVNEKFKFSLERRSLSPVRSRNVDNSSTLQTHSIMYLIHHAAQHVDNGNVFNSTKVRYVDQLHQEVFKLKTYIYTKNFAVKAIISDNYIIPINGEYFVMPVYNIDNMYAHKISMEDTIVDISQMLMTVFPRKMTKIVLGIFMKPTPAYIDIDIVT